MEELLSIGQVAAAAGLNASAIRYYERVGVLEPLERAGGQRRYDETAIRKLEVIGIAQRAGFSLDEIKLLVTPVRAGSPVGEQLREMATDKLPKVEAAIKDLHSIREWMSAATRCDCEDLDVCALFDQQRELPLVSRNGTCC